MKRRKTIGDNPLDALKGQPSEQPADQPPDQPSKAHAAPESPPLAVIAERPGPAPEPKPGPKAAEHRSTSGWWPWRSRKIAVVGGDSMAGRAQLLPAAADEALALRLPSGEIVRIRTDVMRFAARSDSAERSMGAMFGWAVAGTVVAGPLGAAAASLWGGRERRACTIGMQLHDGRHIRLLTDPETADELEMEIA